MQCLSIPSNGSLVRVFHAVPNAPAVDVYVNDVLVFHNITFRQFTNYVPLDAGTVTISIYATATTAPALITAELAVPANGIFTTAATGNIDDLSLLVLDDSAPAESNTNNSEVRLVHLAPNAPAVNVQIDGMPFVQNIRFREMTMYASIPANTYVMTVLNPQNNTTVLTFRITLKAGFISTVYIIGDLPQLSALQSIDGSTYLCRT